MEWILKEVFELMLGGLGIMERILGGLGVEESIEG